jgi:hypothetical protein
MNFLELARRVAQEAGVPGQVPTSVVGQIGDLGRIVTWTASAWRDVQTSKREWLWMRGDFTLTTVASQGGYTAAEAGIPGRFSHWLLSSVRLSQFGPNDEILLEPIAYDDYRSVYLVGPQVTARPVNVAQAPDKRLLLGYIPNLAYEVKGEYQKAPQELQQDTDVPEMPEQYHDLIVYGALVKYARYFAAGEVYEDARMNYQRLMGDLQIDQLPNIYGPEALA